MSEHCILHDRYSISNVTGGVDHVLNALCKFESSI